jgi:GDP-L-fucose synthase
VSEPPFRIEGCRIWIAGHRGMVGSALMRRLAREDCELVTVGRDRLDLRQQAEVQAWMNEAKPDVVILAAARVGGISANASRPADFLHDNLAMQTNVIHCAHEIGVRKLMFLGSSCIYPRMAPQPISEAALLSGPLEPTNRRFRAAALAGDAKVTIWGTGTPRREFLHVDDCADALVFLLRHYSDASTINVGVGRDVTIAELANLVAGVVGFKGQIGFDTSRPDGTPRKLLDVSQLTALGWQAHTELNEGIASTYEWLEQELAQGHIPRGFSEGAERAA